MLDESHHKRQRIDRVIGSEELPAHDPEDSLAKELLETDNKKAEAEAKLFGQTKIAGLPLPAPNKLIVKLLEYKEEPEMLQCKIMQYATLFTDAHVVRELRLGDHEWLEKAVL